MVERRAADDATREGFFVYTQKKTSFPRSFASFVRVPPARPRARASLGSTKRLFGDSSTEKVRVLVLYLLYEYTVLNL